MRVFLLSVFFLAGGALSLALAGVDFPLAGSLLAACLIGLIVGYRLAALATIKDWDPVP